jgi:hypothetical protein
MSVELTQFIFLPGITSAGLAAGTLLEIPEQFYNSATMTRLGCPLTTAQRFSCITWASLCPGWPLINQE